VIKGKLKGMTEFRRRRRRRSKQLLDGPNEKRGYCKLKEETLWRTHFERVYGLAIRQTTE